MRWLLRPLCWFTDHIWDYWWSEDETAWPSRRRYTRTCSRCEYTQKRYYTDPDDQEWFPA